MEYEFILRIFTAALLGGLIGLEREWRAKESGFRTHLLVALGSGTGGQRYWFHWCRYHHFPQVRKCRQRTDDCCRSVGYGSHRTGLRWWHVCALRRQYIDGTGGIGSIQLLPPQVRQASQRISLIFTGSNL